MNNSKLKNIFTLVLLIFVISSGVISTSHSSIICDPETCCQSDCCEDLNGHVRGESSIISDNNCCDFIQGIQDNLENSIIYTSHPKVKSQIIFNYTSNTSIKSTINFHSRKYSVTSPPLYSLTSVLRI